MLNFNTKNSIVNKEDYQGQDNLIQKTMNDFLSFHEEIISSKNETNEALRKENQFLKEALISMQELYESNKHTSKELTMQLKHTREQMEFLEKKYKLIWNKNSKRHI